MSCSVYCAKILTVVAAGLIALPALAQNNRSNPGYTTNNLVSDVKGLAKRTDARVVNPWGVASDAPRNRTFVAENGTGLITILNRLDNSIQRSAIVVPAPAGSTNASAPTGVVLNSGNNFFISSTNKNKTKRAHSDILFATEDGTIGGWNSAVSGSAIIVVDNSASNAVYKSLALASTTNGPVLFAANFSGGVIEAYDSNFAPLGSFTDTNAAAAGFAPFGMKVIQQKLFVAFAQQQAAGSKDEAPTNGIVDIFNLDGQLVRVFAEGAPLNAPWGLALAPSHFGKFSGNLMVGNFGDGVINVFNIITGEFLGALTTSNGNTIVIPGLWSLDFGREPKLGQFDFESSSLLFTAGINNETNGLIGTIRAINPMLTPVR